MNRSLPSSRTLLSALCTARRLQHLLIALGIAPLAIALPAHAQSDLYLTTSQTFTGIYNIVTVGKDAAGNNYSDVQAEAGSPVWGEAQANRVNIYNGGWLSQIKGTLGDVAVYQNPFGPLSVFGIDGGSTQNVYLNGNTQTNIFGGTVGTIYSTPSNGSLYGRPEIYISGGTVGSIYASQDSRCYIQGGTVGLASITGSNHQLALSSQSILSIYNGTVNEAQVGDSSRLFISNSQKFNEVLKKYETLVPTVNTVTSTGTGAVQIGGGNITNIHLRNSSPSGFVIPEFGNLTVNNEISGGTIENIFVHDNSAVKITTGTINPKVKNLYVQDSGIANIESIVPTSGTYVRDNGVVNFKNSQITNLHLFENGTVNIDSNSFVFDLYYHDSGNINIEGTKKIRNFHNVSSLTAFDYKLNNVTKLINKSTAFPMYVSGGSCNIFAPAGISTSYVTGGTIGGIESIDSSVTYVYGGSVPILNSYNSSTITLSPQASASPLLGLPYTSSFDNSRINFVNAHAAITYANNSSTNRATDSLIDNAVGRNNSELYYVRSTAGSVSLLDSASLYSDSSTINTGTFRNNSGSFLWNSSLGNITLNDNSYMELTDNRSLSGTAITANNYSIVNSLGNDLSNIIANDFSTVNVQGTSTIFANGNSLVNVFTPSGNIGPSITLNGSSRLNYTYGIINQLTLSGPGPIDITGIPINTLVNNNGTNYDFNSRNLTQYQVKSIGGNNGVININDRTMSAVTNNGAGAVMNIGNSTIGNATASSPSATSPSRMTLSNNAIDTLNVARNGSITASGNTIQKIKQLSGTFTLVDGDVASYEVASTATILGTGTGLIQGGHVSNLVLNSGTVTVSGGVVDSVDGQSANGKLNVSGGSIGTAKGVLYTKISGGVIDTFTGYGEITMTGGYVRDMTTSTQGITTISGGIIDTVTVTTSATRITGGTVNTLIGKIRSPFGSMTISGGNITDIVGLSNTRFNLSGGEIGHNTIRLLDLSSMNLIGTGLGISFSNQGTDSYGSFIAYSLTGILQGGQSITGVSLYDYLGGYSIGGASGSTPLYFNGVPVAAVALPAAAPEPGALVLFLLGMAPLAHCRRHKKF